MRRRTYLVAIGAITSLAGCTAVSDSFSNSGATPTPTSSNSNDVTPYRDLSERGQQVFRTLLDEGPLTGAESDFPSDLWQATYVGYEESVYAIRREQTFQSISENALYTEFVNESDIEPDAAVAEFEHLSTDAQEAFETARYDRRYQTRERLPPQLYEYEYVSYEGDFYRLVLVVGDIPEWELSAVETN